MSNKALYSVRDVVSEFFHPPFCARNDDEAKRLISMSLRQDRDSLIASNPADFSLVCCGAFDDSTGVVTGNPAGADFICHLSELAPAPAHTA